MLKNKGITLIALIITVIILLILSGAAIGIATNGESLFGKTIRAKEEWNVAVKDESDLLLSLLQQESGNYMANAEKPWADIATVKEVKSVAFTYEIIAPETGKVEGAYELGKVADNTGNVKIADNTNAIGTVKISGFNYDEIFKSIPSYKPSGTANVENGESGSYGGSDENDSYVENDESGSYGGSDENDSYVENGESGSYGGEEDITKYSTAEYVSALEKYTAKLVIPQTVTLTEVNGQLVYDENGTEYRVTEIDRIVDEKSSEAAMNIIIPYGVTKIGNRAFQSGKKIISIFIPDTVIEIGSRAFAACSSLKSVNIPKGVTTIKRETFGDCINLENLTIPNTVTTIEEWAISRCNSLTSITIPNSVITIGDDAFYSCNGLTSITIPESVTAIGENPFNKCSNLESITVDSRNTVYDSRNNCNAIINTATNELISTSLKTVMPDDIVIIGRYAFESREDLTSVTIPSNVTKIDAYAFQKCRNLESVTMPASVTSINTAAFASCTKLKNIYYAGTREQWQDIDKEYSYISVSIHIEYNSGT